MLFFFNFFTTRQPSVAWAREKYVKYSYIHTYLCKCVCMYILIRIYINIYSCMCIYIIIRILLYKYIIYIYILRRVFLYERERSTSYIHIYTYIHTYIYIYIYIFILIRYICIHILHSSTCCWASKTFFFLFQVAKGTWHRTASVKASFCLHKGLFLPISAYLRANLASLRHVTPHCLCKGLFLPT
jgi:hypothetical protein